MTFTGKYRRKEKQQTSIWRSSVLFVRCCLFYVSRETQIDRQTKTEREKHREIEADRKSEGGKEREKV